MSAPAAEQLKRILTLIPHLADGEEHPIEEVAALAGVDRRSLVADLTSVSERYDTPGGWVDGVSITVDPNNVSVRTSHFLRPFFTPAATSYAQLASRARPPQAPRQLGTMAGW